MNHHFYVNDQKIEVPQQTVLGAYIMLVAGLEEGYNLFKKRTGKEDVLVRHLDMFNLSKQAPLHFYTVPLASAMFG